jgi:hypothetical protein
MYLPLLNGGSLGMSFPARKAEKSPEKPSIAAAPSIKGLSYPGPQPIVSDPPKPTNTIQTLLQPALKAPPVLPPPLSLPNLVQIADAGTVPQPKSPNPTVSTPEEVRPADPTPANAPEVKPARMVLPPVPTDVQPEVTMSETILPPLKVVPPTIDMPKVVLPALVPPEPPAAKEPERKPSPPKETKAPEVSPEPPGKAEPAPKAAEKPKETSAKDLPPMSTGGTDPQDILALTPMPAPAQKQLKIPVGEARGRFSISPDPNLTASGIDPGWKVETTPAVVGVGIRNGPAAVNGASRKATATAAGIGGTISGKTKSNEASTGGSGSEMAGKPKAGSGSSKKPFSGITIAGGSYDPEIAVDPGPVVQTPPRPLQTAYGVTVISTENSGGGLPFVGVFSNEQIYTVYLDMRRNEPDLAPSWTLEFAVLPDTVNPRDIPRNPIRNQEGLVLPFPVTKEHPVLAAETIRKYVGRMIIVYTIINIEGKMEQTFVKDSPDALLNEPVLRALSKWVFRPARLNGEPVAVKSLLGIPLWLPE